MGSFRLIFTQDVAAKHELNCEFKLAVCDINNTENVHSAVEQVL
jgi:hypothetical protein